jgi:hypothetical protein
MGIAMIGLLAVVIGAGFSPLILEGTSDNCAAVESATLRRVAKQEGGSSPVLAKFVALSNGRFASIAAATDMPSVPTSLACALVYWQS